MERVEWRSLHPSQGTFARAGKALNPISMYRVRDRANRALVSYQGTQLWGYCCQSGVEAATAVETEASSLPFHSPTHPPSLQWLVFPNTCPLTQGPAHYASPQKYPVLSSWALKPARNAYKQSKTWVPWGFWSQQSCSQYTYTSL